MCKNTHNVRMNWFGMVTNAAFEIPKGTNWWYMEYMLLSLFTVCKPKDLAIKKHVKALSIEHNRKVDAFVLIAAATRQVVPNVIVLESSLRYLIIWCKANRIHDWMLLIPVGIFSVFGIVLTSLGSVLKESICYTRYSSFKKIIEFAYMDLNWYVKLDLVGGKKQIFLCFLYG